MVRKRASKIIIYDLSFVPPSHGDCLKKGEAWHTAGVLDLGDGPLKSALKTPSETTDGDPIFIRSKTKTMGFYLVFY